MTLRLRFALRAVAGAALLSTLAGCGLFAGMAAGGPAGRASLTSVGRAVNDNNWEYVQKVCSGEIASQKDDVQRRACKEMEKKEGPGRVAEIPCDQVVQAYADFQSKTSAYQKAMGERFAQCGHWSDLFEKLVHWGNSYEGKAVLLSLEDAGQPVKAKWVEYMASHPGKALMSGLPDNTVKFALDNIGKYLLAKGHTDLCAQTVAAATGAGEWARVWVMPYLKKAECADGAPVVASVLLSKTAQHRVWACNALGDIGTKKDLEKVQIVASTDAWSEVREEERNGRIYGVKVWPVREACMEAIGRIKLRN